MGSLRNEKIFFYISTKLRNKFTFFFQNNRIKHHSISNQVDHTIMKNSRRNLMQHKLFIIHIQSMPCIWSALESCNKIIVLCKIIDNFSFPLITPLQSKKYINHIFIL